MAHFTMTIEALELWIKDGEQHKIDKTWYLVPPEQGGRSKPAWGDVVSLGWRERDTSVAEREVASGIKGIYQSLARWSPVTLGLALISIFDHAQGKDEQAIFLVLFALLILLADWQQSAATSNGRQRK